MGNDYASLKQEIAAFKVAIDDFIAKFQVYLEILQGNATNPYQKAALKEYDKLLKNIQKIEKLDLMLKPDVNFIAKIDEQFGILSRKIEETCSLFSNDIKQLSGSQTAENISSSMDFYKKLHELQRELLNFQDVDPENNELTDSWKIAQQSIELYKASNYKDVNRGQQQTLFQRAALNLSKLQEIRFPNTSFNNNC